MQLIVRDFEEYQSRFFPWSKIYIEIEGNAFPDEQWWDDSSSILQMWAQNIVKLLTGIESHCSLYFMDGDYYIELTLIEAPKVMCKCFNPDGDVRINEEDLLHFSRQILSAIGKLQQKYDNFSDNQTMQNLSYEAQNLRDAINLIQGGLAR